MCVANVAAHTALNIFFLDAFLGDASEPGERKAIHTLQRAEVYEREVCRANTTKPRRNLEGSLELTFPSDLTIQSTVGRLAN